MIWVTWKKIRQSRWLLFSTSRSVLPSHGDLHGYRASQERYHHHVGVLFDSKLTFEHPIRSLDSEWARYAQKDLQHLFFVMRPSLLVGSSTSSSPRVLCTGTVHICSWSFAPSRQSSKQYRLLFYVISEAYAFFSRCDQTLCHLHRSHSRRQGQEYTSRFESIFTYLQPISCCTNRFQQCFLPALIFGTL